MNILPKPYDWNKCVMEMALSISKMSKDPNTKVGCVIVSPDKRKFTIGYNGFPSSIPDYEDWWINRDTNSSQITKYDAGIHAETNAIIQSKTDLSGWTIYCTHRPCLECTKLIIASGIKHVFYLFDKTHMDLKIDKSELLLKSAGIECNMIKLQDTQ